MYKLVCGKRVGDIRTILYKSDSWYVHVNAHFWESVQEYNEAILKSLLELVFR